MAKFKVVQTEPIPDVIEAEDLTEAVTELDVLLKGIIEIVPADEPSGEKEGRVVVSSQVEQLARELAEELKEDILERYNNSEYWDEDIIEHFFLEKAVEGEEKQNEIRRFLGKA